MRRTRPSISPQIPLFPPAESALRIELAGPQHQELIRALAELLLRAAADGSAAQGAAHDDR
jgi:hypothetical protein